MNREQYLAKPEVARFAMWLKHMIHDLSPSGFHHEYLIEPKGKSTIKKKWSCNSLFDAYRNYEWSFSYFDCFTNSTVKGKTYAESEASLKYLRDLLKVAADQGDNEKCFHVCCMILKWGGVLGSETHGNKQKLIAMKSYLAEYLSAVKRYFESTCKLEKNYTVELGNRVEEIRMNSGFTKIYSLLCDEFIIYDSRVGASLGLLVRHFIESENSSYHKVPEGLSFYYGKAKNTKVNRDPSAGAYVFRALSNHAASHTSNNIKANWLIGSLDLKKSPDFSKTSDPCRAFEAALFMVGYKI
ncbi:hypothetical protein E0Z06_13300 [Rheinheimera sp. D18]|uniref:hypothetical protein n=1 Tax=Rheinheimera sp. D18 TaxID=2545632 RepID=UPI0010496FFB|nr:hypothetical protein [Rheinheimera sp. D18]QBL10435.1 hypothetical protein E0Z06_13300 [Rheinheimera sp. D18]